MTTLTLHPPRIPPAWRWPTVAICVYLLLLLLVFRDTGLAMVAIWQRSETFAHAFVVPPISLWLIWRQRHVLANLVPRPVPWMLLPLVLLGGLWWIGDAVSVNAATQMMLAAMLVAGVPTLLGWRVTQAILFPLAFLFFAVPFGDFLTPVLMQYTADFTVAALRASGIPVYREGLQFIIPSGSWSVVEACSGIRYLMASFMVGSLFAYLNYQSWRRRLAFVVVSLVVPIVANWLRAYMIVMLGHLSGNTLAVGVDHLIYGWVFFGIVIMTMFLVGARWSEPDAPTPAARPWLALPAGGPPAWWPVSLALVAVLAVQAPQLLRRGDTPLAAKPARVSPENLLPDSLAPSWHADALALADWKPVYLAPTVEVQRSYASPSGRVGVYVAYYRDQSETSKLISSENVLLRSNDHRWHGLTSGSLELAPGAAPSSWYAATLQGSQAPPGQDKAKLRVWRLYWIGEHLTADERVGKLWQAWQHLLGRPDDGAVIVLYALQPNTAQQADALLTQFSAANFGIIQAQLAQAQAKR